MQLVVRQSKADLSALPGFACCLSDRHTSTGQLQRLQGAPQISIGRVGNACNRLGGYGQAILGGEALKCLFCVCLGDGIQTDLNSALCLDKACYLLR